MDIRILALQIEILLESKPLQSIILIRRLAVTAITMILLLMMMLPVSVK